jgi:hypothetical protein
VALTLNGIRQKEDRRVAGCTMLVVLMQRGGGNLDVQGQFSTRSSDVLGGDGQLEWPGIDARRPRPDGTHVCRDARRHDDGGSHVALLEIRGVPIFEAVLK